MTRSALASLLLATAFLAGPAGAEEDLAKIGKKLSNPISDVWALFTEFDFAFNGGDLVDDLDKPTYSMGFQPVMPLNLSEDYRLITRPTIPFIFSVSVPGAELDTSRHGGLGPGGAIGGTVPLGSFIDLDFDRVTGLGDTFIPFLLSAKKAPQLGDGALLLGFGPSTYFPTATDDSLGTKQWGLGPTALLGWANEHVTVGAFPQYWWGYASEDTKRSRMNQGVLLYFFFFNLPKAMQIGFNPNITYDARASSGNKWNVPVGLTVTKMTKIGKLPVKFQVGAEYSVVSQDTYGKRLMFKLNIIPVIQPLIKGPIF